MRTGYFMPSTLRVCIDEQDDTHIEGRIYCKMLDSSLAFHDFNELLLLADKMFDQKGFPQSYQQKRGFGSQKGEDSPRFVHNPELYLTDKEMASFGGRIRTLDILVYTRMYASWQGAVMENGKILGRFDSEMGLMKYVQQTR